MGAAAIKKTIDAAPLMIRDIDGTILHWTHGMERLYGWSHHDTLGRNVHELLRTVFPARLEDIKAQLKEEGQWAGDLLNTRRDGEVIVAASHWFIRRDADDVREDVVALDSDVTHARRASEAVQHLANIVQSSDDAIISKTLGGIITTWNDAAESMFGYTSKEAVGRPITILFPPARMNEEELLIEQIRRGERVHHFETVRRRKDGTDFPVSLTISPILDAHGKIVGASKIIRDVTERKLAQATLEDVQSEFFHLARLNTISHMASGLAHELNQPLTAVANYLSGAQRLLEGRTDELSTRLQNALARAYDQAVRAGQVVRRLRDFMSRGDSDRKIESLAEVIRTASDLALVGMKDRGVSLALDLHPGADQVCVDKTQIQQVLLNLARNAVEAMETAERRELAIATTVVDGDMVEVSVADTGPGIPPDVAAQLFQPFVTTKGHGMGVGLSISRTIIEAHGGHIRVEPNPQGGTIFRFTIPLAPELEDSTTRA